MRLPVPPSLAIGTGRLVEAQALHRSGRIEDLAVAHFTLGLPAGVAFGVAAGLATVLEELAAWHVPAETLGSLACEADAQGRVLLAPSFVDWLGEARACLDADAMREGTPALHGEPLLRLEGPVGALLLVADCIADTLSLQTRAATAAARLAHALPSGRIVEAVLGLGGAEADAFARGAHIGGAHATANLRAALRFGIPAAAGAGALGPEWWSAAARAEAIAASPHALFVDVPEHSPLAALRTAIRLHADHAARGGIGGVRVPFGADLPERVRRVREVLDAEGAADLAIAADARAASLAALAELATAAVGIWEVADALLDPALAPLRVVPRIEPAESAPRLQVRRIERDRVAVADVLHPAEWSPAPNAAWEATTPDGSAVAVEPERDESVPLLVPVLRRGCREDGRESLTALHEHAHAAGNRLPLAMRGLALAAPIPLARRGG